MKKYIKIIIAFIIVFILLLVISLVIKKDPKFKLKKMNDYFIEEGYKTDDNNYYLKEVNKTIKEYNDKIKANENSKYEALAFNISTQVLTKLDYNYRDGVRYNLKADYDFNTSNINYFYEVAFIGDIIYFEGYLDTNSKKFECNFSDQVSYKNNAYCDNIRALLDNFYSDITKISMDLKI